MFRYTNIINGNTITTFNEIKGKNWMKSDEIEDFRKQAAEAKAKSKAEEEKVEEKEEKPVVSKEEIPNDLESLTKSDLSEILFDMDIDHSLKMTKEELIKLIEANK